jgi:hypothetical protein
VGTSLRSWTICTCLADARAGSGVMRSFASQTVCASVALERVQRVLLVLPDPAGLPAGAQRFPEDSDRGRP